MTMSVEANKNANNNEGTETKAMLQELNELMDYIDADNNSDNEELIDPAFFIGNINESIPDVPTLTTVANEPVTKHSKVQSETSRQPGLFSARVERFKQNTPLESTTPESTSETAQADSNSLATQSSGSTQPSEEDVNRIVDALLEEQLPKLEAQLRERILASIQNKKEF